MCACLEQFGNTEVLEYYFSKFSISLLIYHVYVIHIRLQKNVSVIQTHVLAPPGLRGPSYGLKNTQGCRTTMCLHEGRAVG